jgi:hypothetical protein
VRDQASHLYQTTGKNTVLYIFICILLDSKLEGLCTKWCPVSTVLLNATEKNYKLKLQELKAEFFNVLKLYRNLCSVQSVTVQNMQNIVQHVTDQIRNTKNLIYKRSLFSGKDLKYAINIKALLPTNALFIKT